MMRRALSGFGSMYCEAAMTPHVLLRRATSAAITNDSISPLVLSRKLPQSEKNQSGLGNWAAFCRGTARQRDQW